MQEIATLFYSTKNHLRRLDLSHNSVSGVGAYRLFMSLRANCSLQRLSLDGNNLNHVRFRQVQFLLNTNKTLESLSIANC